MSLCVRPTSLDFNVFDLDASGPSGSLEFGGAGAALASDTAKNTQNLQSPWRIHVNSNFDHFV